MTPRGPIVHVISPSPAGGAESVVVALASAARDRTRVVILNQVADAGGPSMPLTEQLQRRGIAVHEVRCGRRQYRAEARALEAHLRETGTALVHTHGYHGTWVGYFAARRLGLPMVATVHGYLTRSIKERLYNVLDRWLLRKFDGIIAVSKQIHEQLVRSGVPASKIHLVQNGLAAAGTTDRAKAREVLGLEPHQRVVGWIGRLSPEKGPDLFLRALALEGGAIAGLLVGDGPERQPLTDLARTLGLGDDRVKMAGFRADAAELLPAFDALALSSRMEGTPMVILEAVAAGIPIVAFAVGGIPEVLDQETAWVVPREDVGALAAAMREALASPAEARKRAAAASARLADRLSLERWSGRVWDVYDAAIAARASRRPL